MPSICPRRRRSSAPSATVEDLELQARRAGVDDEDRVHVRRRRRSHCGARVGVDRRDRAGGEAGADAVGARREDDRHAGAEHDAGGVGMGEEGQVLRQHVAGLEVGDDEDLGVAGDRAADALDPRGLGVDGVVEGERPLEQAAGDLAALGHLAEGRGLDGRGDLRRHRLDRGEDRDPAACRGRCRSRGRWRSGRCRAWRRGRGRC